MTRMQLTWPWLAPAFVRCVAGILGVCVVARVGYAQSVRRDVLQGVVQWESGAPSEGATILVTRLPDRSLFQARSGPQGTFRIVIDSGTGDYLVFASLKGARDVGVFRARVRRIAERDSVIEVRVVLAAPTAQSLDTVKVVADRPVPERSSNVLESGVGAVEQPVLGVSATTTPEQRGDLEALMATSPGLVRSAQGLSAFGVNGQNLTTLNGMAFAGASVPRDVRFTTRVSTTTYDPSRGWFGGAETSLQIEPGAMLRTARASATVDNRALQGGDRLGGRLGQEFSSAFVSVGGDGYAIGDRVSYSVGAEVSRRTSPLVTPNAFDTAALERVGLAPDSVSRALQILAPLGVPLSGGRPWQGGVATTTASMIARLNTPEFVAASNAPAKHSLGLILYGFHRGHDGFGVTASDLPTREGRQRENIGAAQVLFSTLSRTGVVHSVRSSLSLAQQRSTPALDFPTAEVFMATRVADSIRPNASLGFGGAAERWSSTRITWETQSRTTFYATKSTRHLLELTADARLDVASDVDRTNANGAFVFADLDAVADGRPLSFSRALTAARERGVVWNGFLSLSDSWRVARRLRVMVGMRAEGTHYASRANFNPAVHEIFGVRNDYVPNRVAVSPRVGFQWRYSDAPATSGYVRSPLGALPWFATGIVRGGFGRFRGFMSPDIVTGTSGATGLAGSQARLACFGGSTPIPDWRAYVNATQGVPDACVQGTGGPALEDASPAVALIAPGYSTPDSWRASVGWAARNPLASWSLDLAYAWNLHQSSVVDLNFVDGPRFVTAGEGRPVFVSAAGIVASTGAVSPTEARRSTAFGPVMQSRSDLSGIAKQLVLQVTPNMGALTGTLFTSVAYTLGRATVEQRGFRGTAFGSPLVRSMERASNDVRHTFLTQVGVSTRLGSVTVFGRFASGAPFTPLVQSDVNGDGLSNDRAFVFEPQQLSDADLAMGMRRLLTVAPEYARRCLTDQLGRAATHNSCTGPWTATMIAQLSSRKLRWRDMQVSLTLFNVPGILDRLVHGTHQRGWGNAAAPDPVLFSVYGFDPARSEFRYRVNPRFGDTWAPGAVSPFRITLDVRLNLGPSESRQIVGRLLDARRSRGSTNASDATTLTARLRRSGPQPYRDLMELSDSLELSAEQVRALETADERLRMVTDSVWRGLAEWITTLPLDADERTVVARQRAATDRVWELARQSVQQTLRTLLSPRQLQMLPWPAALLWTSTKPITGMGVVDYREP